MKAVFQQTMLSLVCLAGVVVAAPRPTETPCTSAKVSACYIAECLAVSGREPCQLPKPQATAPVMHDSDSFLYW